MSSTPQRRGAAGPDATGRPVDGRDIHGCAGHELRAGRRVCGVLAVRTTAIRKPFEYFYGFMAREASQYEPHLGRNTTVVPPPKTPGQGYHLSEDLAEDAISWLRTHKATTASASAPAWGPRLPGLPRTGALPVQRSHPRDARRLPLTSSSASASGQADRPPPWRCIT
jgi:hypothetical protein